MRARAGERTLGKLAAIVLTAWCVSACHDPVLQVNRGALRLVPNALTFEPVFADGRPHTRSVSIINDGRASLKVTWSALSAPFTVSAPEVLPSGETVLTATFLPTMAGHFTGNLTVTADGVTPVSLQLEATAREIPGCTPSSPCVTATFDVDSGRCVETVAPDGTTCNPHSVCVERAACQGGRCIGAEKPCDDGNECTVDVCNATNGCEHLPRPPCPGDGKCMVGVCNPRTGCELQPAEDGTTCGSLQSCTAAEICITGQCVVRDPPDGYLCAEASPCQSEGRCSGDVCVRSPSTTLTPSWSFDTYDTADFDAGIGPKLLHDFVLEPTGDMTLGGFFDSPAVLRANTADSHVAPLGDSRRCILWNSQLICADYPSAPNGKVTALDLSTAQTLWTFDIRTQRPDFVALTTQIFLARLVVQAQDRLAALYESYPIASGTSSTLCRRYFLVVLDAQGSLVTAQMVEDPLLDQCNHPHPYGVVSDAVGNLFIAFSPTVSQAAPLKPDHPTLMISYTRDGIFRWKTTDTTMVGGELAVARGLLYPENGNVALMASTGQPAFALPEQLGRIVVSDTRFMPAPREGQSQLHGYEAGQPMLSWTHQLPAGTSFWSDQIRLASWKTSHGTRVVALTFVAELNVSNLRPSLRAINVHDGSEAFTCPIVANFRTAPQLFELAEGSMGVMEGALDENGLPACGKCDPPFAGSAAAFHTYPLPGLGVAAAPWIGTFGGPSHDHHEELVSTTGTSN